MQLSIKNSIESKFGHKIRIRSCGILIEDGKILLIKHLGLGDSGEFWNCPGGGLGPKENLESALLREFKEETNLNISINEFAFATEFINKPLHAIEFYFMVNYLSGELKLGIDPEITDFSVLNDLKWFDIEELARLENDKKPNFLKDIRSFKQLKNYTNFGRN